MAKPSDREFALQRKIKDLEAKNRTLEERLLQLQKKIEKMEQPAEGPAKAKTKPKLEKCCPDCESAVKVTELPFGKLSLCAKACGWRNMESK